MSERVAIVGSRGYPHQIYVAEFVKAIPLTTVVVSGGAEGPDTWAERAAKRRGLLVVVYRPDWSLYGKAATFIRNGQIVANCDRVVAFWDGSSQGTKNTIDIANQQGKPVEVYGVEGECR